MAKASKKAAPAAKSPAASVTHEAPKTAEPPKATHFKIAGKGTIPLYVDGAMTRLPRGEAIKLTQKQRDVLDNNGVKYAAA